MALPDCVGAWRYAKDAPPFVERSRIDHPVCVYAVPKQIVDVGHERDCHPAATGIESPVVLHEPGMFFSAPLAGEAMVVSTNKVDTATTTGRTTDARRSTIKAFGLDMSRNVVLPTLDSREWVTGDRDPPIS